jgi:hypothetical protein
MVRSRAGNRKSGLHRRGIYLLAIRIGWTGWFIPLASGAARIDGSLRETHERLVGIPEENIAIVPLALLHGRFDHRLDLRFIEGDHELLRRKGHGFPRRQRFQDNR